MDYKSPANRIKLLSAQIPSDWIGGGASRYLFSHSWLTPGTVAVGSSCMFGQACKKGMWPHTSKLHWGIRRVAPKSMREL